MRIFRLSLSLVALAAVVPEGATFAAGMDASGQRHREIHAAGSTSSRPGRHAMLLGKYNSIRDQTASAQGRFTPQQDQAYEGRFYCCEPRDLM